MSVVEQRFWSKVNKTESESCWLWTGATMPNGYGRLTVAQKGRLAHRFAYELVVGPIPDGLVLDHLCRVRNCVNPSHLEPVTQRENTLRGDFLGGRLRRKAAQTHCAQGHPWDEANTYYMPSQPTLRRCRACGTASAARRRNAARKAAAA